MSNRHIFKNSSSCAHCDYEDDSKTLIIKFQSGDKEHRFMNVPKQVFEDFKKADSPGKFFHSSIRKNFQPG